ncbi:hypothetical protein B0H14DRAFT_2573718 [Mycena olivaceomarginata]|nr:hypothetical protein B0H14DRAFT_2573718 [Mycena olivaceomarginata]
MAAPTSRPNRQPRPPGRSIPLKIYKGSLENREDSHAQDLLQLNIDKNETSGVEEHHLQAALATSTVRIPTPGSIQLVENYAELYPSNRWMDTEIYLQSSQTILSSIALTIHPHWQQRRSLRGGRKIFPSLNSEENDYS